jgi:hypothetical protein
LADAGTSEELDDDRYDEADLIGAPDGHAEPGFVMKITMRHFGVWRRLRPPGELTAYGDDDGNLVPVAGPEPRRVYDLARINHALARVTGEPDETGDPAQ